MYLYECLTSRRMSWPCRQEAVREAVREPDLSETHPLRLRPTGPGDLDRLHALSLEAVWPHRREDWRFVSGVGRGIAACDETGRVGGCALWWPHGEAAGSVGMVIVSPALQGRGTGRRLMRAILDEAGPRRLLLNATSDGRSLYESEGFLAAGTVRQHQGLASHYSEASDECVRPMTGADRDAVLALDAAASGADRSRMLDALAAEAWGHVHDHRGTVTGFAFARAFGHGHLLGPLIAPGDDAAIALARPSLARHTGAFLRVDTPVAEGAFPAFLAASGLAQVDEVLTMVRGASFAPRGPARIYALAAQALG